MGYIKYMGDNIDMIGVRVYVPEVYYHRNNFRVSYRPSIETAIRKELVSLGFSPKEIRESLSTGDTIGFYESWYLD